MHSKRNWLGGLMLLVLVPPLYAASGPGQWVATSCEHRYAGLFSSSYFLDPDGKQPAFIPGYADHATTRGGP